MVYNIHSNKTVAMESTLHFPLLFPNYKRTDTKRLLIRMKKIHKDKLSLEYTFQWAWTPISSLNSHIHLGLGVGKRRIILAKLVIGFGGRRSPVTRVKVVLTNVKGHRHVDKVSLVKVRLSRSWLKAI